MLVNDSEVNKRLNNPLNLINRKIERTVKSPMSLFIRPTEGVPAQVPARITPEEKPTEKPAENNSITAPSASDLVTDVDDKVKLALAHDRSIDLLNSAVEKLHGKIDEISAAKLPSVIAAASKTIEFIRKERLEKEKNNKNSDVHFHFYCPEQKKLSDYEVIEVVG